LDADGSADGSIVAGIAVSPAHNASAFAHFKAQNRVVDFVSDARQTRKRIYRRFLEKKEKKTCQKRNGEKKK
jgi:hypothetical protein